MVNDYPISVPYKRWITPGLEDGSEEYLETPANFFCTEKYKFHVEGSGLKRNTTCIYRQSEAGRSGI